MRYTASILLALWMADGSADAQGFDWESATGSYETGLEGWTGAVSDPQRVGASVAVDPAQSRMGDRSLRIDLPGVSSATATSPPIPARGGADHLLTFWYRSEGFSATSSFAGVNLQYVLQWLGADGRVLSTDGMGLSYGAVPQWKPMVRMFTPPPQTTAVTMTFPMSVSGEGRPSRCWLDAVRWREWPGEVKPDGRRWVFHVADGNFQQELFRRVADDATATGFAVLANPRFQRTAGYLAANLYTREVPAGQYRVIFRLKVDRPPDLDQGLLSWDVNTDVGGVLAAGKIGAESFPKSGEYQDVTYRFVVPPGVEWIDPRLVWHGHAATWIDTITIVEEKTFTADDIRTLMESTLGPGT